MVSATHFLDGGLEPRGIGRERGQRDVHVGSTERLLPTSGAALPYVAQLDRPRRHALLELWREAVERVVRQAERLQALVGEGHGDPGAVPRLRAGTSMVHNREQPPHQLTTGRAVIDAEEHVLPDIGRGPLVQRPALDVV
jgi:hypothetical protein